MSELRFSVPDTAGFHNGVNSYIPVLLANSTVMSKVSDFGLHSYGDSGAGEDYADAYAMIQNAGYPDVGILITETRSPQSAEYHYNANGAKGVIIYEGYDSFWAHHGGEQERGFGIISYDDGSGVYTPTQDFWDLRFTDNIPKGSLSLSPCPEDRPVGLSTSGDGCPATSLPILGWNAVPSASVYDILLGTSAEELRPFAESTTTAFQFAERLAPGVYYWAVEARNPGCSNPTDGLRSDPSTVEFCEESVASFRRGDANEDEGHDIGDVVFILYHLFHGSIALTCPAAADTDADLGLAVDDAVYLLSYLFLDGPAPSEPFESCGSPTAGELPCAFHAACM